jgi:hypothetical protein
LSQASDHATIVLQAQNEPVNTHLAFAGRTKRETDAMIPGTSVNFVLAPF